MLKSNWVKEAEDRQVKRLADFYMWMVENGYFEKVREDIEVKIRLYLKQSLWKQRK